MNIVPAPTGPGQALPSPETLKSEVIPALLADPSRINSYGASDDLRAHLHGGSMAALVPAC